MTCTPNENSAQPVWSETLLCAQWVAKDPSFLHADNEDSDQSGRMLRLNCVFAGRTCHFVGFVMRRLKSYNETLSMRKLMMSCNLSSSEKDRVWGTLPHAIQSSCRTKCEEKLVCWCGKLWSFIHAYQTGISACSTWAWNRCHTQDGSRRLKCGTLLSLLEVFRSVLTSFYTKFTINLKSFLSQKWWLQHQQEVNFYII